MIHIHVNADAFASFNLLLYLSLDFTELELFNSFLILRDLLLIYLLSDVHEVLVTVIFDLLFKQTISILLI